MDTRTTETILTAKRFGAAAVVYLSSHMGQPGTNCASRPEINLDWRCGP